MGTEKTGQTDSPITRVPPLGGPTITGVRTVLVDVPLGQRTITDSQSRVDSVEFVQVMIETDAGITGYGFNWNYTKGMRAVQVIIDDCYGPAVVGQPALARQALMNAMHATTHFIGRVGVARDRKSVV